VEQIIKEDVSYMIKDLPLNKQEIQQLRIDLFHTANGSQKQDLLSDLEKLATSTKDQVLDNPSYLEFWEAHEALLDQRLQHLQSDSRVPFLQADARAFLSRKNKHRHEMERHLEALQGYRDKELKKLERRHDFRKEPSVAFKKQTLDHYLRMIEQVRGKQGEEGLEKSRRKNNYGKWFLQPKDFKKSIESHHK